MVTKSSATIKVVKDLIQFNLLGHPVVHQDVSYPFDPDAGIKRSRLYQEVNGIHGEKAIERLGLGIDGNDYERLLQQRARDEGLLNGHYDLLPE